jgi:Protein of unknown function (DUF2867)
MNKLTARAKPCATPLGCSLTAELQHADFYDSYCVPLECEDERSALELFLQTVAHTPDWVHALMAIRNRVVGLFGLKNLGALNSLRPSKPASAYQVGDPVGIFTLLSQTPDEAVLFDDDKHLRVSISVQKLKVQDGIATVALPAIAITTVVHVHNLLGRLYMLPVGPIHKLVAPAVLSRANRLRAASVP